MALLAHRVLVLWNQLQLVLLLYELPEQFVTADHATFGSRFTGSSAIRFLELVENLAECNYPVYSAHDHLGDQIVVEESNDVIIKVILIIHIQHGY